MGFLNFGNKNTDPKIEKKSNLFHRIIKRDKADPFENKRVQINTVEIDSVTPWFQEQLEMLENTEDVKLLVLKKTSELLNDFDLGSNNLLVQCIYNTKTNNIVESQIIDYKTLSDTITSAFNDTDMIVLK
ncbi:hypothetical protein GKZ89_19350 [Bacillus mangrovi]|uniref:Uncharacterized protein n=1 Tax=Metabacillus mangrovi TaxID=1491830 RepID=A0A7X2S8G7_9BACI|nr:hypothetical protein [Metabacillus mangrovi]MTH55554.1 hypothetical protein [Metabacillus mangrovi]